MRQTTKKEIFQASVYTFLYNYYPFLRTKLIEFLPFTPESKRKYTRWDFAEGIKKRRQIINEENSRERKRRIYYGELS